ncbi:MAG: DPP IV N-terminal domain-containing protein [Planctomycetes bacterium]|nr:DPP IV N-terminal domain-containing protein [Planctomycetota bacterium]
MLRWIVCACLAPFVSLPQSPTDSGPRIRRLTHAVNAYASWSPDGKSLVYQSSAPGNFDLFTITVDGSAIRELVADPAHDITPVWSPDGKTIAFVSERTGNRDVYLVDSDGANLRNLTRDPAMDIHPAWSADGKRLLFSSNRGNANADDYDIYELSLAGGEPRRITGGPDVDTYASWSPDGRRIVTRRVVAGNNEVFVMDADGANPKNLTNAPTYDGWPVWSPDGKWIAYAGGPDEGNHYLFLVRPDGSARAQLTKESQPLGFCYDTQPAFSPDGRSLVFTRYRPMADYESSELCILDLSPFLG